MAFVARCDPAVVGSCCLSPVAMPTSARADGAGQRAHETESAGPLALRVSHPCSLGRAKGGRWEGRGWRASLVRIAMPAFVCPSWAAQPAASAPASQALFREPSSVSL
eukprot:11860471-Alexandrium_andersonii.AAC.1